MEIEPKTLIFYDDEGKKAPLPDALRVEVNQSELTRKMARNLLFCLVGSFVIVVLGFVPSKIGLIGLEFQVGRVSLAYGIAILSAAFAALGAESWLHDFQSYNERTYLRTQEINEVGNALFKSVLDHPISKKLKLPISGLGQNSDSLIKAALDSGGAAKNESKEFWNFYGDRVGTQSEVERALPIWEIKCKILKGLNFWLPASVPLICLGLAIGDPFINPSKPAPTFDIGNYEQIMNQIKKYQLPTP